MIYMKPLIIVESFTKTKTISKYLDNKYNVICSLGHINNLPKSDLGINITTWVGKYEVTNKSIIANIKKFVKESDTIYIASDPDMEGEAIAHHIYNSIANLLPGKKCHRIEFHEITKKAVLEALENPHNINSDIVDAQESRRFVDRLVGYKLSPLLWNKFNDNTLSVGRVQSIALLLCVMMTKKLESHIIDPHWIIKGYYESDKKIKKEFIMYKGSNIFKIQDKKTLYDILGSLHFGSFKITIEDSKSYENPSAPYTTTSLQQDSYNKFKFSSKKTMMLAQQLYENGMITYMRTDSTHISDDFKMVISSYIANTYGKEQFKNRSFIAKIANAQNAHEAIRITDVCTKTVNISTNEGNMTDLNKLYDLIWKRTVASQMISAEYTNVSVIISYDNIEYRFVNKSSLLVSPGYLVVYDIPLGDVRLHKDQFVGMLAKRFECEASVSNPPSLYNEMGLIKALEKEGIGRPSTYSSIIDKLIAKKYVKKGSNPSRQITLQKITKTKKDIVESDQIIKTGGKNSDLLVPSELGINVIEYLRTIVPFLLDIKFTSVMEDTLDKICDKVITKKFVLDEFYNNYLLPVLPVVTASNKRELTSGVIKSKYGYCYYNSDIMKYTNIESYLKWKNITAKKLTKRDLDFFQSLPKKLDDGTDLHIGQYGLYIKDKNKNVKLDQSKWESFI